MIARFLLWIALSLVAAHSHAATINVERTPSGVALIVIAGDMVTTDSEEFRIKVASFSDGIVLLHSNGGSLVAGMEIGRTIRMRNFTTYVPSEAQCASACALAWLGGTNRMMGRTAQIGFHAVAVKGETSGMGNALMGKYLADLGLSYSAVAFISSADPDSMNWLSATQAEKVGIAVSLFDPGQKTEQATSGGAASTSFAPIMKRRVSEFLVAHFAAVSGTNSDTMKAASRAYADTVKYFGKAMSRDQVVEAVSRFIDRWPVRNYRPRDTSVLLDCDETALSCTVKGTLDFEAKSPIRNERSYGAATFEFLLKFSDRSAMPSIHAENGALVDRRVAPLVATPPQIDRHSVN